MDTYRLAFFDQSVLVGGHGGQKAGQDDLEHSDCLGIDYQHNIFIRFNKIHERKGEIAGLLA